MHTWSRRPLDLFGEWNLATNNVLVNITYYATIVTILSYTDVKCTDGTVLCERVVNICDTSHCWQIRDIRRSISLSFCVFVPNRALNETTKWIDLSFRRGRTKFISNAIHPHARTGQTYLALRRSALRPSIMLLTMMLLSVRHLKWAKAFSVLLLAVCVCMLFFLLSGTLSTCFYLLISCK